MTEPGKDTPFHRFQRAGATEHQLKMLTAALRASPELNRDVTEVMRSEQLTRINVFPANTGSNGEYDLVAREIRLRPKLLNDKINKESIDKVVNVMAHETSHASRGMELRAFDAKMYRRAHDFVQTDGPRNWTGFVGDAIAHGRREEALAELDGINTLADRIRHENKGAVTEAELAKRLSATSACVTPGPDDSFRFKPGITFNPASQSVQPTADNLEIIAKCHFDENPHYRHHYAAGAISKIADRELAFRTDNPMRPMADNQIDLARLGLGAETLRKAAFRFDADQPFQFMDISRGQRRFVEVRDTSPRHGSPELQRGRTQEDAPQALRPPTDPAHPDHDLLKKLQDQVSMLDQRTNKGWDEQSERLSASALVMARRSGFTAEDDLKLAFNIPTERYAGGELVHLFRRGPNASVNPAANRVHMATAEALATPVEDRFQQLAQINQEHERAQVQQLAQQQSNEQAQSRLGPRM